MYFCFGRAFLFCGRVAVSSISQTNQPLRSIYILLAEQTWEHNDCTIINILSVKPVTEEPSIALEGMKYNRP